MMLRDFHFLRPAWLLAIPLLLVLVWLWRHRRGGNRQWAAVCDPQLLPALLLDAATPSRPRAAGAVLLLAGLLALFALSGPSWERLPQPVFRNVSALVVLLDLSASMNARDIRPSRLIRARYKLEDLLRKRREGQTALVVYAAEAFDITPLTDDNATIAAQLPALGTDLMPAQGSRADRALAHARRLLKQSGLDHGDVLLITDGIPDYVMPAVRAQLDQGGLRLSILGVGTTNGAPIAGPRGDFLKDARGNIILPRLDSGPLRELAADHGGIYQPLSVDDHEVDRIIAWAGQRGRMADQNRRRDRDIRQWRDFGPWLLLPLLPLAALAFRRGILLLVLIALLPLPRPAQALDWDSLWRRPDQQAWQALQRGQAERAARLFQDPGWQAAARYLARDYDGVLQALRQPHDARDWYNRGNALARLGRYREALQAYDQALALESDDADAAYNRRLVSQALKKRQQDQAGKPDPGQGRPRARSPSAQDESGDPSPRTGPGDGQGSPGASSAGDPEAGQRDPAHGHEAKDGQNKDAAGRHARPDSRVPPPAGGRAAGARQEQAGDHDEGRLSREQWLRRIPDDPGGLLRRKFRYQYRQRADGSTTEPQQW